MNFFSFARTLVALSVLTLLCGLASAQSPYPNRLIRMIVPFGSGGSTDALARMIAQKLSENLGQPVIVDNRTGGNTVVGADALVKSAPDGYTLYFVSVDHAVHGHFQPTPYHPVNDFAPVATISYTQLLLVANPALPVNNVQELITLGKSNLSALNIGTAGAQGVQHLTGDLFNGLAGTKMQQVPYRGGGPAMLDVMGGQIQLYFSIPLSASPHIKSGKLKPIAITGLSRSSMFPNVPTFAEAGVQGMDVKVWFGMFAPSGTPKPVLERLNAEISRIIVAPDVKENLIAQGMEPYVTTGDEFAAMFKSEFAKWGRVVKSSAGK